MAPHGVLPHRLPLPPLHHLGFLVITTDAISRKEFARKEPVAEHTLAHLVMLMLEQLQELMKNLHQTSHIYITFILTNVVLSLD